MAKTRVPKEMAKNENNLNESKGAAEGSQIERMLCIVLDSRELVFFAISASLSQRTQR
jgi:hypothetical protein